MKNTPVILLFITAILFASSCKKHNDPAIILTNSLSGSTVTLNWTPVNNPSVDYYIVCRITDSAATTPTDKINVEKNQTSWVDTLPRLPKVRYYVVAKSTTPGDYVASNEVDVTLPENSLLSFHSYVTIYGALFDAGNQKLYAYSNSGFIAAYDLNSKTWTNRISEYISYGYCDLGVHNGTTELYVPRGDGWLFIYDAAKLTLIDQINIGGTLTSVVYNNGILYVSGTTTISYNRVVTTYNRATKTKIGQTTVGDNMRLKLIPGSNTELYGIYDNSYSHVYDLKFGSDGTFISQNTYSAPSSMEVTQSIFEVFPDGNHFITSAYGSVSNYNCTSTWSLPRGGAYFNSFCFDNTNQLIYAGCEQRKILAYSMNNYQLVKTITTSSYPSKVFYSNGSVVALGTTSSNYYSGGYSNYYWTVDQY